MIRLDTTTRKIQALLGGSITTNQLPITVCYSDKTSTAYTGGTTVINTNNTTAVDICAAPAASTVRDVDTINVNNADTVAATITIRYNDNGTTYTLFKATLATGDQLTYVHGVGWNVIDSTGKTKVGAGVNGPGSSTDNALVRWDGTAGTAVQNSGWTLSDTDALNGVSGSVGAPSLTLNSETTSGLYRIGANNHGWAISGNQILNISSTGLSITGTFNAQHATAGLVGVSSAGVGSAAFQYSTNSTVRWSTYVPSAATNLVIANSATLDGSTGKVLDISSTGLAVTGTLSATSTFNVTGTGPHAIGGATQSDTFLNLVGSFTGSAGAYGLLLQNTLTPAANGDAAGVYLLPTLVEAGSGTHANFSSLQIAPPTITGGAATLTNASTLKITGAPTGATNNYALWASGGSVRIDGTGPHAIGGATDSTVQWYQRGAFTGASSAYATYIATSLSPAANGEAGLLTIAGTINKAGSGTHADFVGLYLVPPTIGAGASALTNASTLKITGAPTGATNNYALWVDAGTIRFDGTTGAGANTGTLTNAPSTGNPAYWMPVNANGTTYYIPCWT